MPSESDRADAFLNRRSILAITARMVIVYAVVMTFYFWNNRFGLLISSLLAGSLLVSSYLYLRFSVKMKYVLGFVLIGFLVGASYYRGYRYHDGFGTFFEVGMLICPLILIVFALPLHRAKMLWRFFLGFTLGMSLFVLAQYGLKQMALIEFEKTAFVSEKKSEDGFSVHLDGMKDWKFVEAGVAERLFKIKAKDASLVLINGDANKYALFYGAPKTAETSAKTKQDLLLKRFMTVSKSAQESTGNIQELETTRGLATSGIKYENGFASTYVGFQRDLPSVTVTLILGSPEYQSIELFADLENMVESIEASTIVSSDKTKRTAIDIYDEYNKAVVLVQAYDANRRLLGFGSGFNVSPDGLIVTNLHVLAGGASSYIIVKFPYHGEFKQAVIAGVSDPQTDLALLDIDGDNLPSLGDMSRPEVTVGQAVFVIGNPQGLINTLSPGIISGVRERGHVTLYQITAPISGGSSGGPVFNEYGEVICVATASHQGGQNLNFCTSIDQVERIRETSNLRREASTPSQPVNPHLAKLSREFDSELNEEYLSFTKPGEVKRAILYGIEEGAKLFNQGDHDGTFQIYDYLARKIIFAIDPTKTKDPRMKNVGEIVNATRQVAMRSDSSGKAAWVLRYGFDIILKAKS